MAQPARPPLWKRPYFSNFVRKTHASTTFACIKCYETLLHQTQPYFESLRSFWCLLLWQLESCQCKMRARFLLSSFSSFCCDVPFVYKVEINTFWYFVVFSIQSVCVSTTSAVCSYLQKPYESTKQLKKSGCNGQGKT